jgi:hypothetical protein
MAKIRLDLEEAAGRLPDVCMRCGKDATVSKWRNMSWYPPWVNILAVAALLPAAIVAMILTKKASVKAPFCDQHKGHWFNRSLLMWGTFFLFGGIGFAVLLIGAGAAKNGRDSAMPFVCMGDLFLVVAWLTIVVVIQSTAIRPKEITDEEIVLAGVCDEFVDAVEEAKQERYARRRKRLGRWDDDEAEGEDDPRPAQSNRSTHVREDRPAKKKPPIDDDEDEPKPRKKRPTSDEIEE